MNRANRTELGRRIERLSGWLLLMALVGAPWWYGSTRVEAIWGLGGFLTFAGAVGLAGFALKGRFARVPWICWATGAALVVMAWALVPRAGDHFISEQSLELILWHLERWPASTTVRPPAAMALLATGMIATVFVAADLGRDPVWRRRIVVTMVLTGGSIAVFGIGQVLAGTESIFGVETFGDLRDDMPGHFFSTFFHHSIAGAFLNLVWPLALGLILVGKIGRSRAPEGPWNLLLGACMVAMLLAILANVSKAAMVLAMALLLAFLVWPGIALRATWSGRQKAAGAGMAALILAGAGFFLANTDRGQVARERWEEWYATVSKLPAEMKRTGGLPEDASFERLAGGQIALRMIEQSGWTGFGPGSWMKTFPDYTGEARLEPFWLWMQFAHQDYLQTAVEWGLLGALLWGILVAGGLWRGMRAFKESRWDLWASDAVLLYAVIASLVVLYLHALGDFPLQIPSIQLYAAVLLGMAWSAPRWRQDEKRQKRKG